MTITSTNVTVSYAGNGVSTAFAVPFIFFGLDELAVYSRVGTGALIQLVRGIQYTVTGGNGATGTVTATTAPAAGTTWTVRRQTARTQQVDYTDGDPFPAATHEGVVDRLTAQNQEADESMGRAIRAPFGDIALAQIPTAPVRANQFLMFDGAGAPTAGLPSSGAAVSVAMAPVVAATTIGAGKDLLGSPRQFVNVEQYGAKGDGVTDDSAAINAALAASYAVRFAPGVIYKITSSLIVPVTCRYIEGRGSAINGPGGTVRGGDPAVTIDGFVYSEWNQASAVDSFTLANYHYLPSIKNVRRGISLTNASWVKIRVDYILWCTSAFYMNAPASASGHALENDIDIGMLSYCTTGFDINCNSGSWQGIQGCRFRCFYVSGPVYGIKATYDTTGAVFINNVFDFTAIDGAGSATTPNYAVWQNIEASGSNAYLFTGGLVGFSTAYPFHNISSGNAYGDRDYFQILGVTTDDPTPLAFGNFLAGGPKLTCIPGAGTMTVYVATTGSDTTGNGGSTAPFATIARAMFYIQNIDMMGWNAVIKLADGTYAAGLVYTAEGGQNCRGTVFLTGNTTTPANVIINDPNGAVQALGGGVDVFVTGVTIINNGISCTKGASVYVTAAVVFGACAGKYHVYCATNGHVVLSISYGISGGAAGHWYAEKGGTIDAAGITVTLTGTPAFSSFFAAAARNAVIAPVGVTFTGAATGPRYLAILGGGIDSNGAGATYLPGNSAGTATSPGYYN